MKCFKLAIFAALLSLPCYAKEPAQAPPRDVPVSHWCQCGVDCKCGPNCQCPTEWLIDTPAQAPLVATTNASGVTCRGDSNGGFTVTHVDGRVHHFTGPGWTVDSATAFAKSFQWGQSSCVGGNCFANGGCSACPAGGCQSGSCSGGRCGSYGGYTGGCSMGSCGSCSGGSCGSGGCSSGGCSGGSCGGSGSRRGR